jgi:hypothetical protein
MRAIVFGCHLVPVFLCTRRYVLIRVAQFSIGESKFSLVAPLDLGSGLERGIGSNPSPGKSFEIRDLHKLEHVSSGGVAVLLPVCCPKNSRK